MPTFEELYARTSPEALDIFRKQLPQTLKAMGELERNTALERLQGLPEFQGLFESAQQPVQPAVRPPEPQQAAQEAPWWQTPLDWLRSVETGAGTLLAAPFTPSVPGTQDMSWWEREKAEYEVWEAPSVELGFNYPQWLGGEEVTLGVKGALELTP